MTDVKITGRSTENAILLLAAARSLDLDDDVVRSQTGGYLVPEEVAEVFESEKGESADSGPEETADLENAPAEGVKKVEAQADPAQDGGTADDPALVKKGDSTPEQVAAKKAPAKKAAAKKAPAKKTTAAAKRAAATDKE